jgi:hypothetical protein
MISSILLTSWYLFRSLVYIPCTSSQFFSIVAYSQKLALASNVHHRKHRPQPCSQHRQRVAHILYSGFQTHLARSCCGQSLFPIHVSDAQHTPVVPTYHPLARLAAVSPPTPPVGSPASPNMFVFQFCSTCYTGFTRAKQCYASKDSSWYREEGLRMSEIVDIYDDRLVVDD